MLQTNTLSKTVHKNAVYNVLFRILGIIGGLILLKVNITFLGVTLYGVWVTIASVSAWANIGDLGISNGLRNELSIAIAEEDYIKQKGLIKTAFVLLSVTSFFLFLILSVVTECLFVCNIMESVLRVPMYITNAFFCISFVFGIGRTVAYSYQKSWLATFAQTATIFFQIVIIWFFIEFEISPNLIAFAIVVGLCSILGNVSIISFIIYSLPHLVSKKIKGQYSSTYKNAILNVGLSFFVIQLACLILYATDNVIINKLYGGEMVAKYNVISNVYQVGGSLFSLFLISLWSATTYAFSLQEYAWIKREIRNMRNIWYLFALGVVIVTILFNWIVKIWLGQAAFYYEMELLLIFAVYILTNSFGSIYINVANGLGRIKNQIIISVAGAIINIPLSVFLASYCSMGLTGIKLATFICCIFNWVIVPIDITKFLNMKMRGV